MRFNMQDRIAYTLEFKLIVKNNFHIHTICNICLPHQNLIDIVTYCYEYQQKRMDEWIK